MEEQIDPEYAKYIGELGVSPYIPIIPGPKDRLFDTSALVLKALENQQVAGSPIPHIWTGELTRSLRPTELPWPTSYSITFTPPTRWERFKTEFRSRIARWLHTLSEKFEECGYRDY